MTTTSMYQGLQGEKNTSRVLQPPGGGSSNIFGTEPANVTTAPVRATAPPSNDIFGPATPTKQPIKAREDTANNIFGGPDGETESPLAEKKKDEDEVTDAVPQATEGPSASQSAQANARRMQQGAGNPITGAAVNDQPAPIVRVRQPPGGTSSKLW